MATSNYITKVAIVGVRDLRSIIRWPANHRLTNVGWRQQRQLHDRSPAQDWQTHHHGHHAGRQPEQIARWRDFQDGRLQQTGDTRRGTSRPRCAGHHTKRSHSSRGPNTTHQRRRWGRRGMDPAERMVSRHCKRGDGQRRFRFRAKGWANLLVDILCHVRHQPITNLGTCSGCSQCHSRSWQKLLHRRIHRVLVRMGSRHACRLRHRFCQPYRHPLRRGRDQDLYVNITAGTHTVAKPSLMTDWISPGRSRRRRSTESSHQTRRFKHSSLPWKLQEQSRLRQILHPQPTRNVRIHASRNRNQKGRLDHHERASPREIRNRDEGDAGR